MLILKDKGGHQECLLFFFILTSNLRYSQKRGVNRKRGEVLEVVLPERESNDLPWGRKNLRGSPGMGETIQINYKINFIQHSCQRFSLHFKSTFPIL